MGKNWIIRLLGESKLKISIIYLDLKAMES